MRKLLQGICLGLAAVATFKCDTPDSRHAPIGQSFDIPTECGQDVPQYGPISVGTRVFLGRHSTSDQVRTTWWNSAMDQYLGSETVVTQLAGVDLEGCPYVRVAADGGAWGWRIRDMSLVTENSELPYNPQNLE